MKIRSKRWQSAAELLRALEPFLPGRRSVELQIDESPYAGLSSFQRPTPASSSAATRDRGDGDEDPRSAVDGGRRQLGRRQVVVRARRSRARAQALGRAVGTIVTPGRKPMDALAAIVAPLIGTASNLADEMAEQQKLAEKLRKEPGHLGHVLRGRARRDNRASCCSSISSRLYTHADRPSARRSPRASPLSPTMRRARCASCCRFAPTSSIAARIRRSSPS